MQIFFEGRAVLREPSLQQGLAFATATMSMIATAANLLRAVAA